MMGLPVPRKLINPFRIKRRAPKYSIECTHFREREDGDSGVVMIYDLHTEGNTLDELIENAKFWRTNGHGHGGRNVEADSFDVQVYITAEFIKLQERERRGR